MNPGMKYFISFIILVIIGCLPYFYILDEKISFNRSTLAQIKLFEGPHLIYQNEHTKLITAVDDAGKMKLKVESITRPERIEVFKPGKPQVRFTVPIKQQIITPPVSYPQPEKLFTISDVEGNFNTVTGILKQHKVIDDELNWAFGKGHLVIIGDIFDRGNHVTELLWLVYRLETQAQRNGGFVHFLIGNHEIMNMQNHLRYAESKYVMFGDLLKQQTQLTYVDLFRNNTELGKWLRSKNIVEKIGDKLFVHAGISPAMVEQKLSLTQINQAMRAAIDTPKDKRSELEKLLFGRNGPIWYRGYFKKVKNLSKINNKQLTDVLAYYNATSVIVGHTIVGNKPQIFFDGQIIAVAVKQPADHLFTFPSLTSYGILFAQDGGVFVVDGDGGVEKI